MKHTGSSPKLRCRGHVILAIGGILTVALAAARAEPLYTVTDLGDLPGGSDESWAYGINNVGQVVGWSFTETGTRAFLWENGVMTPLAGTDPLRPSRAYSINDAGVIAGSVGEWGSGQAAMWEAGALTPLPNLPGQVNGGSFAINAAGQIAGYSGGPTIAAGGFSAMWEDGAVTGLAGVPTDVQRSQATGVNAAGEACGWYRQGSLFRAYRWNDGVMTEISTLPGAVGAQATGINDSGHVVGTAIFGGSPARYLGFLWDGESTLELGFGDFPPDTNYLVPRDITNDGVVVGGGPGAFIWTVDEGTRDLNNLLDASGDGWALAIAYSANELGQIVGVGTNPDGVLHGYLLTPIPEPAAFAHLALLATVCIAGRRR